MKTTPPPMQLLPAFVAASEQQSFKKAAEHLYVTPSAVSQQIKTLEQWFEQPLFRRESGGVVLTPFGQKFYRLALELLDKYKQGYSEIYQQQAKPTVRISTLTYVAQNILIPAMPDFQSKFPHIDLRIESSETLVNFDKEWIDFAIRIGKGDDGHGHWPGLQSIKLTQLEAAMLAAPEFIKQQPLNSMDDLSRMPLIHSRTNHDDWQQLADTFSLDFSANQHLYFDNYYSAITAAENGLGVILGLLPITNASLRAGRLQQVIKQQGAVEQACYLLFANDLQRGTEGMDDIIDWLKELFKLDALVAK